MILERCRVEIWSSAGPFGSAASLGCVYNESWTEVDLSLQVITTPRNRLLSYSKKQCLQCLNGSIIVKRERVKVGGT